MPLFEHLPITVTVTVEVDGHKLTFAKDGKAIGSRYHGRSSPYDGETLEDNIREVVGALLVCAANTTNRFLSNAYPVVADQDSKVITEAANDE
jgi:hypothetical protein